MTQTAHVIRRTDYEDVDSERRMWLIVDSSEKTEIGN